MDFGVLSDFNPWWQGKKVPKELLGSRKRPFYRNLEKNLSNRFIILLYGLRRVGKTTALYQLIEDLLDIETNPRNILYFSFDEKNAPISDIISAFEEKALRKRIADSGRVFIFFDEIQKAHGWEEKIKVLYDLHHNLKIYLSGSAAVSLRKKSAESLAGRMLDMQVEPLSFPEFLEWKGANAPLQAPELAQGGMIPLLADYLRKGGLPEITLEEEDETIRNYVKNAVLEKIIYRDIPEEFGAKDTELLKTLLEIFIMEPGMIINVDRLSKDLARSKVTVANYIEYLKGSLLIREIRNLRPNLLLSSRKAKKIYPASTAFCFAMRHDFYLDSRMEKIYETAAALHMHAEYYYRNAFEVDFVEKTGDGKLVPVEVKHGRPDKSQLIAFMEKFGAEKGMLVTREKTGEENGITTMTLWQFLLRE